MIGPSARTVKRPAGILLTLFLVCLLAMPTLLAAPTGATVVSNVTETVAPSPAGSSTTTGGSFTTLVLNATTQTPRWKAYVGNITNRFVLQNAANYSIYDWGTSWSSGEVYSSRTASPDWNSVGCVQNASLAAEQTALNMSGTSVDSINLTFNRTVHRGFWVGTTRIANSTCRAIATFVNSTNQSVGENARFQEVLLQDSSQALVFSALIDQDALGFNNQQFDFQMIVPEDEYATQPHTYYFWLEVS
jgi:hypothetical protein